MGLMAFAMAARYWYFLIGIAFLAFASWIVAQGVKYWFAHRTSKNKFNTGGINVSTAVTGTPAPVVVSDPKADILFNQQPHQYNPELQVKTIALNYGNTNNGEVYAAIGKDLAKEKAAAEVAIKIINRLGVALVDAEIQRILVAKKAALHERLSKVNTEIEQLLATEKATVFTVASVEKAAAAKVTTKTKAADKKVQVIKRLLAVLDCVRMQRFHDAEKTSMRECVAQVNAEIKQILAIEKAVAFAIAVDAEKAADAEVAAKERAAKEVEQNINKFGAFLVDVEIQRILESEKTALRTRVVQVNAEIEQLLATEKADAPAAVATDKSADEIAIKQIIADGREHIDNKFHIIYAPTETQLIFDSENMGMSGRVAQENAEIQPELRNKKTTGVVTPEMTAAAVIDVEQQAAETEKRVVEIGFQGVTVSAAVSDCLKKQYVNCDFCNTLGLHSILSITGYTIECSCIACGGNFFISKFKTNSTPTPTVTEPKITQMLTHFDFVLTNKVGPLKTGYQWFEEKTQKRRLRTGSPKAYEWLLPFMPLEVAKLYKNMSVLERGPGFAHVVVKELRVLIRERRQDKKTYNDLLRALYGACVLVDFAKDIGFLGMSAHHLACYIDIRELLTIEIDYSTMGYCYNGALLKTDIKWLIEVFGEPVSHQKFNAIWPEIRQNAISRYCWEKLANENKTVSCRSFSNTQKNMDEWLIELIKRMGYSHYVNYNERYQANEREKQCEEIAALQDRNHKEWLGRMAAREARVTTSMVSVEAANSVKQRGFAIPEPPKSSHSFSLDMSRIEMKLAETVAVSAILKDIFADDVPVPSQIAVFESTDSDMPIAGLDAQAFKFMQVLALKLVWTREELEKLAADYSLMLDGTLDTINDASFDHFGGPFLEGDDPIEINAEFAKEIVA